jgi:P4 family phage/plasmid primase-like protien
MKAMIFLNTAWMERYEGLLGNDKEIHGGGSYVEEYGYGHEIFNFKKISGKVYGYAQPSGYNNLQRLGASEDDEFIDDVLVIFTATHKNGGTYIVGWYKNARFFKDYQNTNLSERKFRNEYIGYYAVANADNATLLSIDERFSFPIIPRRVKGGMGQSNVWYADSPEMVDFKKEVLRHIERYEKKKSIRRRLPIFRQTDAELRKKIENIAIREVTREYSERGFTVTSVESENLGWDRFIHEIMSGDEEKAKFLQKAFGYSISGDTRYECLFVLYGATTRNGKGTLCESILKVLGSYGCTARPETISLKKNNNSSSPSEDIARLAGVRYVNISEPSRGLVLNAAQVKSMTGGDTINARFLHENSFDFSPKLKLYINTNYLPVITDMTLFSSGRVVIIPFERHFDESEQDKNLKREFAKPKNQSAILNWLIEGYQLLKKDGFTLPDSVKTATEAYKHDSDKIALFFEDALEESPNSEVRTSEVYARYQRWCSANGCYSENARNFKQALTAIARVERKRPRSGGGMTTMLIGYKLTEEEFLLI